MPRRRAVGYIGGALAATALGGLYPRSARASHCMGADFSVFCPSQSDPNAHGCCGEGRTCCYDSTGNATDCCLPEEECRTGNCVDPCEGLTGCTDTCCQRFGQGECCGSLCCTPDQVCDRSRNICCPPDPDGECLGPEQTCKDRVDFEVRDYQREICQGKSDPSTTGSKWTESTFDFFGAQGDGEKAAATLGCMTFSEAVLRRSRYSECPQVPYDSRCDGATCDPSTGLCRRCSEARRRSPDRDRLTELRPARRRSRGGDPRDELNAGVRRMRKQTKRAARLMFSAEPAIRRPEVAEALRAMRAEVMRTRKRVADLRPSRAQRDALELLKAGAKALKASATAFEAPDSATAQQQMKAARSAWKRGGRASEDL